MLKHIVIKCNLCSIKLLSLIVKTACAFVDNNYVTASAKTGHICMQNLAYFLNFSLLYTFQSAKAALLKVKILYHVIYIIICDWASKNAPSGHKLHLTIKY